jgi:hypothetical protein
MSRVAYVQVRRSYYYELSKTHLPDGREAHDASDHDRSESNQINKQRDIQQSEHVCVTKCNFFTQTNLKNSPDGMHNGIILG